MGMEMSWYLLFPIFFKFNNILLFVIVFISLNLRSYKYRNLDYTLDPYNVHFFPYEIALFIIGQLEYRLYSKHFQQTFKNMGKSIIPTLFVSLFLFFYDNMYFYFGQYSIILLMVLLLPYLFFVSSDSKVDRWFGERVYCIFIWHFLIQYLLKKYYIPKKSERKRFLFYEFLICFGISVVFEEFIQKPINIMFKPKYVIKTKAETKSDENKNIFSDDIKFMLAND